MIFTRTRPKLAAALVAPALCAGAPLAADTITLDPSADAGLFELDPGFNFGAEIALVSGTLGPQGDRLRGRALYRFDIASALPAGAEILSAELTLYVTDAPPDNRRVDSTFELHRLLTDWAEGDKSGDRPGGDTAENGDSTWTHRQLPDLAWSAPGGQAGVDFAEAASGSRRVTVERETYVFALNEVGLADLKRWRDQPEENHGWILISASEDRPFSARRFGARENRTEERRPKLIIESALPAEEILVSATRASPGAIQIAWNAAVGAAYRVETRPSLSDGEWTSLLTIVAESAAAETIAPASRPAAFFRVVRLPD